MTWSKAMKKRAECLSHLEPAELPDWDKMSAKRNDDLFPLRHMARNHWGGQSGFNFVLIVKTD